MVFYLVANLFKAPLCKYLPNYAQPFIYIVLWYYVKGGIKNLWPGSRSLDMDETLGFDSCNIGGPKK